MSSWNKYIHMYMPTFFEQHAYQSHGMHHALMTCMGYIRDRAKTMLLIYVESVAKFNNRNNLINPMRTRVH